MINTICPGMGAVDAIDYCISRIPKLNLRNRIKYWKNLSTPLINVHEIKSFG